MPISNIFSNNPVGPKARDVSARDRERFFFLMSMMLKSGQTSEAALRTVAKSFKSEGEVNFANALNSIAVKVAQGRSLSKSMESEPFLFSDIHRAAIMAGELSNRMQKSFEILQKIEDKKILSSRGGMTAILTPTLMLAASSVSLFNTGLNTLPKIVNIQKAMGKPTPAISQFVLDFTGFCADYWYLIVAAIVTSGLFIYSSYQSTQGRFTLDKYMLNVPVLGKFISYKTYASMLLYFPHLIDSGVKPKQMIPIMEALSTNVALRRKIEQFNHVITTGGQMSQAMEKAGFPGIAVTPVAISEHYSSQDNNVNDAMIEGMNHAHTIMERILTDINNFFVGIVSGFLWILGGMVMLIEMVAIVLTQS